MSRLARTVARALAALGLLALAPVAGQSQELPTRLDLEVGERHVVLTQPLESVKVEPQDAADVARLGAHTLVITPHREGLASLELTGGGAVHRVRLNVHPRAFDTQADDQSESSAPNTRDADVTRALQERDAYRGPMLIPSSGYLSGVRPVRGR